MMGFGVNSLAFGDSAWSFGHTLIMRRVAGTAKPSMTNGEGVSHAQCVEPCSSPRGLSAGGREAGLDVRGDHLGSRPSPERRSVLLGVSRTGDFYEGSSENRLAKSFALAIPNSRMALSSRSLGRVAAITIRQSRDDHCTRKPRLAQPGLSLAKCRPLSPRSWLGFLTQRPPARGEGKCRPL
jgi:hypothetical protein